MNFRDSKAAFEVKMILTMEGAKYEVHGKVVLCPFCENQEGDKEACGLCEGSGIFMKIKNVKPMRLRVIQGGKK